MRFRWIVITAVVVMALAGVTYLKILPGLSVARQEPSRFETEVATYLLRHSVPASARDIVSRLSTSRVSRPASSSMLPMVSR